MKYMIEYKVRQAGLSHDQNLTNWDALVRAFGQWEPAEGLTVHAFVAKLTDGGYVLVEANEPALVSSFVAKFLYWNDFDVIPVVEVANSVSVISEALAWTRGALSLDPPVG